MSVTRIAESICARVALDSANRNYELPLLAGGSHNAYLRKLIVEKAAAIIEKLGRKVVNTNVGTINPEVHDIIVVNYKTELFHMLVNARNNLETAIVARVLEQLASDSEEGTARWYRKLVRVSKKSLRG